jgi:hypothetical protein
MGKTFTSLQAFFSYSADFKDIEDGLSVTI